MVAEREPTLDVDLFTNDQPQLDEVGAELIESDPVIRFLNRWAFNWRWERAVIEKELRELIARKVE